MRALGYVARPLLGSMFVVGGLAAAKSPGPRVAAAEKLGIPSPALAVRANGAAMVLGGAALAASYKPRRSALLLVANLIPTTYAGHAFWEAEGDAKKMQQTQFFKNMSMLGGLLLAVADAPHKSEARAVRHAAKEAKLEIKADAAAKESRRAKRKTARKEIKSAQKVAASKAKEAQKAAAAQAKKAAKRAAKIEAKASKKLSGVLPG